MRELARKPDRSPERMRSGRSKLAETRTAAPLLAPPVSGHDFGRIPVHPPARPASGHAPPIVHEVLHSPGLPLDHVNSHHHFHLHPILCETLLKVGKEYGLRTVRFPYEPPIRSWRASKKNLFLRLGACLLLFPWILLLRLRLSREKMGSNDSIFGMIDSGNMTPDLVDRFLKFLPQGVTEIYLHPALSETNRRSGAHRSEKEFETLMSPKIRQTLRDSQIERIAFSDLP